MRKITKLNGSPQERIQKRVNYGLFTQKEPRKSLEIFRHLVIYNVSNWYDDLDIQMVETYFNEVESCM